MTRKAPPVRQFMSRIPMEAEHCQTVIQAEKIMQENQIRHMPVMSGSKLQAIVSQRDILAARARYGEKVDQIPLHDICETDVLKVDPMRPVHEVADLMLKRRVGSAVVVDGGFVVGVFTTTDALRVLTETFH